MAEGIEREREIVLTLLQGGEGQAWASSRQGWSSSSAIPLCQWDGITCDPLQNYHVSAVDLSSTNLLATLPWELSELTALKTLNLRQNLIWGIVPQEVSGLQSLEVVELGDNRLSGMLPSFEGATNLKKIDLSKNMFTGSIPEKFVTDSPNLALLDLTGNGLAGPLEPALAKFGSLTSLSMMHNSFTGTISPDFVQSTSLKYLYLNQNHLVGSIPDVSVVNNAMMQFWLHENELSGTIPESLSKMSKLENLYLDGNKLTGTVPPSLCRENLNADFFAEVDLNGETDYCQSVACPPNSVAPDGLFPCIECDATTKGLNPYLGQSMECLNLSQDQIVDLLFRSIDKKGRRRLQTTGKAGRESETTVTLKACERTGVQCDTNGAVTEIHLRGRGLTGTIPGEIGFLEKLKVLDLSNNQMTGYLPSDLRWAPLEKLQFSNNKIVGVVPPLLCQQVEINTDAGTGTDCSRIGCPVGTFSPEGYGDCEACPVGQTNHYIASTSCPVIIAIPASTSSGKRRSNGLLWFFIGDIIILLLVFIAVQVWRKQRNSREDMQHLQVGGNDPNLQNKETISTSERGSWLSFFRRKKDQRQLGVTEPWHYTDTVPATKNGQDYNYEQRGTLPISPPMVYESNKFADNDDVSVTSRSSKSSRKMIKPKIQHDHRDSIASTTSYMDYGERSLADMGRPRTEPPKRSSSSVSAAEDGAQRRSSSVVLKELVKQQQTDSSGLQIWEYPDPLEQFYVKHGDLGEEEADEWAAGKDSNKEVWLDVPKI